MDRSLAAPLASRRFGWDLWVAVAALGSFSWLLTQGRIPPLVVYLIELYLAF